MSIRCGKAVAAIAAMSPLAILALSPAVGFAEEPAVTKPRPITIVASPSILQPGTRCRVEVEERPPTALKSIVTTYEGTVAEADDRGIRLDVREVRRVDSVPAASKLPFSDRLFRNVGIGRPDPDQKVPPMAIAAAKIRSVTVLAAAVK
ncbi:hypothetical protein [Aquisphaera insulae]|uniref:hypothetical protein n=1 Tax=Aquisphaera insulae TaxID=2712864 RepID=UPI0013ECA9EB|nr:hypothetical protein [Aquisphaera insulae]